MNILANNIKIRLKAVGLTQKELADRANISQVMVHKLVSGKTTSTSKIMALAKALNCSPDWLMYGDKANKDTNTDAEWVGSIEPWGDDTILSKDELEVPFFTEVELAAGDGAIAISENHGPKLRFAKSTLRRQGVEAAHAACVKVNGNSMEPVLPTGSTVGIDTAKKDIIDGKMYAINHDGMLRVKLVYQLPGGGIRLRSYNSDEYPDEHYDKQQASLIQLIGRVFWYSVLL
ncbi:helix-turn-helix transcriptional regulator [uncultured Shewanella sp.]|uniref:XRE family transcriptional regulator n=1 Tax=uncultured Shewanella sp. TaxID=173975 RepID=UPI00261182E2|nr:helix-turn-helix transcriptional regulator [uncultured Shewanella sp.]